MSPDLRALLSETAWLTDTHLEFAPSPLKGRLWAEIRASGARRVLLTGDIANARCLLRELRAMRDALELPVYFVLGNHDYYHSSIGDVNRAVSLLCQQEEGLTWATEAGLVALSESVALIGHEGWGDGRHGNFIRSPVILNDYRFIEDLAAYQFNPPRLLEKLNALGDRSAEEIAPHLHAALASYPSTILLTHAPPFREGCLYRARVADDDWAPLFTNKALGDLLLRVMPEHPDRELIVLCGHAHHRADIQPLPNLRVLTGGADYRRPEVQGWGPFKPPEG